jgi:hypothetical protein
MTKAWGLALSTIVRIAVSFIGSANPFAFRAMVRRDTGAAGGTARLPGIVKVTRRNNRKREEGE